MFEKIGLSYENIIEENNVLKQRLENWHKHIFFHRESNEDITELKEQCKLSRPDTAIMFEIIYCRYLILNQELSLAEEKIKDIKKLNIKNQVNRNYFLFINVLMLFYYVRKEYQEAIKIGIGEIKIENMESVAYDYEIGAYHYNLALNYKSMYIYVQCNHQTELALKIFLDGYYLEQAMDCHILLAISYNHLGKTTDSLNTYNKAKRLLNYLPNEYKNKYLAMIEHNTGYCYQKMGEYRKAISSYANSLTYKKNNEKLLTMINLIQCYKSIGEKNKSKQYLLKALELENTRTPKQLKLHLSFLRNILLEDSLSEEKIKEMEFIFMEFVNSKLQEAIIYYGEELARILESSYYYKKANKVYQTMLKAKNQLYD